MIERFLRAIVAAGSLAATVPAAAQSAFTGTWLADLDAQSGLSADIYLVANGTYECRSCTPPRAYPVHGRLRPVGGAAEPILEAMKITGARSIETHIVGRALDRTTTMTVAADDATATYISLDRRPGIRGVLRTEYLARRVSPAPSGAHPVSGTWQGVRYVAVPAEVRTTWLRERNGYLSYRTPLGTSFTAKIGGGYVPIRTAQGSGYRAAVRRLGPRRLEERIKRNEVVVAIRIFTVAPDGASMEIANGDGEGNPGFHTIARRQ